MKVTGPPTTLKGPLRPTRRLPSTLLLCLGPAWTLASSQARAASPPYVTETTAFFTQQIALSHQASAAWLQAAAHGSIFYPQPPHVLISRGWVTRPACRTWHLYPFLTAPAGYNLHLGHLGLAHLRRTPPLPHPTPWPEFTLGGGSPVGASALRLRFLHSLPQGRGAIDP
jgi:hypothetical protein